VPPSAPSTKHPALGLATPPHINRERRKRGIKRERWFICASRVVDCFCALRVVVMTALWYTTPTHHSTPHHSHTHTLAHSRTHTPTHLHSTTQQPRQHAAPHAHITHCSSGTRYTWRKYIPPHSHPLIPPIHHPSFMPILSLLPLIHLHLPIALKFHFLSMIFGRVMSTSFFS
jgi:hypothetical protein